MLMMLSPSARRALLASAACFLAPAAFAQSVPVENPANVQVADRTAVTEEVVVTAAGFAQKLVDAPASITVLNNKDLREKAYGSLAEALVDVEGVDVGDTAGKTGGLNISMRGMPSDYTLVLVDGRRQNAAGNVTPNGFGETSTSFMPPLSAIERIEVVRGPMSTLYGSDAMGGVINIITRKVGERWGGAVTLDTTLNENSDFGNTSQANFYLNGPLVSGLAGLAVRGSILNRGKSDLSYTDASGNPVEVSKRGPSPVEALNRTAGARLTLTPSPDHDLWVDVDGAWQRYENSDNQLGTVGTSGGYGPVQKFERMQYTLAHTWRINGDFTLDSNIMRNRTETIGRTLPPGTPGKVAGAPRTLEAENTIYDTKLNARLGNHITTVGGQWWDAEMVDGVAPAPYEHRQWALFAENEWRFIPDMALTLGVRHDDHSVFGGQTSPRAYLVWNASEAWTFKGGVSRGYKTPRLDQLADGITGFTGQGTIPSIGSPGLKPETSTSTEIAAYFDDGGWLSGNLTLFNNEFQDKIASGPGLPNCSFAGNLNRPGCVDYGNWPRVDLFSQSVNVDEAVTRGGEAALRARLASDLTLSANYTYTYSEQKSGAQKGLPLNNTPKHMLNGALRWATTDQISTWVRSEYRSKRYRSDAVSRTALGDFKSYVLFHVGGAYEVSENVTINATVYNVLDKDFLQYLPYRSGANTVYANEYNNNQPGRRLWLAVNVTF